MEEAILEAKRNKPAAASDLPQWNKNSANAQEGLHKIVAHPEFDRNELPQEIFNRNNHFHKYGGLNRFRTQLNKLKELYNRKSTNQEANKLGKALGKFYGFCLLMPY